MNYFFLMEFRLRLGTVNAIILVVPVYQQPYVLQIGERPVSHRCRTDSAKIVDKHFRE